MMALSLEEQISRKCIHFNGIMNDCCKAGIKYADVRIDKPYKFPCLQQGGKCGSASFRTEEEIKAKIAAIEESGIRALTAIALVKGHYEKTKDERATIACSCGGKLSYAVAKINGHIWASCTACGIAFNE